jgi:outer membrane autotransporter protein
VTSIVVHDADPQGAAGPNAAGILIVKGASSGADFVLDPNSSGYNSKTGLIDEGFFAYGLDYNAASQQVRLVSAPDAGAHELPELVTAAQTIWYDASPEIEPQDPSGGGAPPRGVWMQGFGEFGQTDVKSGHDVAGLSGSFRFNTGYHEDAGGVIGGLEIGRTGFAAPNDAWTAGLMLGYVDSRFDFHADSMTAQFSGPLVGAYASYVRAGWFVTAQVKADLLQLSDQKPGASGFSINPEAQTLGAQVDFGRRSPFSGDLYFEPMGPLAGVNATIGNAQAYADEVHFGSNQSLRVAAGFRVGGLSKAADDILDWNLTARLWDEADARNRATLIAGGQGVDLSNQFTGPFAEVTGALAIKSRDDRWVATVSAGSKFRDGYAVGTASLEVKARW